jgi:hypothetical protein
MSALVAAAGAVLQSMACMVADWMRSVTMDAIVAAAGAIVQRMARMMGDRVVSCPHDICCSIRGDSVHVSALKILVCVEMLVGVGIIGGAGI